VGRVRVLLALAAAAAVSLVLVGSASAGADPAGLRAPVVVRAGNISAVFLSDAYQAAHPSYLQQLAKTAGAAAKKPVMVPDSHYGCNRDVCINVVGSSTHVTEWSTDVVGNRGCIKAFFAMRHGDLPPYNTVWGPEICSNGQSGVYITYYNGVPTDFPNGDQLCNGWLKAVIGYPCARIIA
jgi:hypothetical protein